MTQHHGNRDLIVCWLCDEAADMDAVLSPAGYAKCTNCGLVFQPARNSLVTEAERYTQDYFDQYPHPDGGAQDYDQDTEQRGWEASRRLSWVRERVSSGRLMEIGAASGTFVRLSQASGFDAAGVEPATTKAETARSRGANVRAGTLAEVSAAGEAFDVVCAWHVVEHLPQPRVSVAQLVGITRPGGWIFLELPNIASVAALAQGLTWRHLDPRHHVAHYEPASARRLMSAAGAVSIEAFTISERVYASGTAPGRGLMMARESVRFGTPSLRHPWRHELLRVVARAPIP